MRPDVGPVPAALVEHSEADSALQAMWLRVVLLHVSLQVLGPFESPPATITFKSLSDVVVHDVAGCGVLVLEPHPAEQAPVPAVVPQPVPVQHVCRLQPGVADHAFVFTRFLYYFEMIRKRQVKLDFLETHTF